jgi:monoamine oxidase
VRLKAHTPLPPGPDNSSQARNRVGGRILSPEHHGFFSDLGPSWYWPDIHPNMARLIQGMGLEGFHQFEEGNGRYQNSAGAVRTVGGFGMEPPSWRLAYSSPSPASQ